MTDTENNTAADDSGLPQPLVAELRSPFVSLDDDDLGVGIIHHDGFPLVSIRIRECSVMLPSEEAIEVADQIRRNAESIRVGWAPSQSGSLRAGLGRISGLGEAAEDCERDSVTDGELQRTVRRVDGDVSKDVPDGVRPGILNELPVSVGVTEGETASSVVQDGHETSPSVDGCGDPTVGDGQVAGAEPAPATDTAHPLTREEIEAIVNERLGAVLPDNPVSADAFRRAFGVIPTLEERGLSSEDYPASARLIANIRSIVGVEEASVTESSSEEGEGDASIAIARKTALLEDAVSRRDAVFVRIRELSAQPPSEWLCGHLAVLADELNQQTLQVQRRTVQLEGARAAENPQSGCEQHPGEACGRVPAFHTLGRSTRRRRY